MYILNLREERKRSKRNQMEEKEKNGNGMKENIWNVIKTKARQGKRRE